MHTNTNITSQYHKQPYSYWY